MNTTSTQPAPGTAPGRPTDTLSVTVDGVTVHTPAPPPHTTALSWLRDQHITSIKEGCAEGECGACALLVRRNVPPRKTSAGAQATPRADGPRSHLVPLNGCLTLASALAGAEIYTARGLGSSSHPHPVHRALASAGGSQCGYCTPGFACSLAAAYYADGPVDHEALGGNLCRCTGYRPILEAADSLPRPAPADAFTERFETDAPAPACVDHLHSSGARFVRPATLAEAAELLSGDPEAVILAGGTDWAVATNQAHRRARLTIAVDHLTELTSYSVTGDGVRIGAALPLASLAGRGDVPLLEALLPLFASPLIRNAATLGGNLASGSPIADSPPVLLALNAEVTLARVGRGGLERRTVALSDYFIDYRKTARAADEIIESVRVPLPLATRSRFYKVSKRRLDDISSVAVAFALDLDWSGRIEHLTVGVGGVAATPLRCGAEQHGLAGVHWNEAAVERLAATLAKQATPLSDHRASADYRGAMLGELCRKFAHDLSEESR
ncbi:FAD binding domain-containing protein [Micrococcales bacterium 31B]|nr:FAD binding domain-containing protein [Micrococcales bacterium 31B]